MTGRLMRHAYEELVEGDLKWLRALPRSLERDHVIAIVQRSPDQEYGSDGEAICYLPLDCPKCGRRRLEATIVSDSNGPFVSRIVCESCGYSTAVPT